MQAEHLLPRNILMRLWLYQAERFPLLGHGPVIGAFSFSAVCFSLLLRGETHFPGWQTILVSFFSALLFFLQLRLADEFKDFDEDSRYRPYRPVPRGLVTLRELGWLWGLTMLIQLALALWLNPALVFYLMLVWAYLGLMSREFFVREWLKARPITYLWTHMLIVPLIDFYTTACDWRAVGDEAPHWGLAWFLVASFFNGVVIELGRKIRAPGDEEHGVETYTFLWGRSRAVGAWLGALAVTAVCGALAGNDVGFGLPAAGILFGALAGLFFFAVRFLRQPVTKNAKALETLSGLWTILMYLAVGFLPLLVMVLA